MYMNQICDIIYSRSRFLRVTMHQVVIKCERVEKIRPISWSTRRQLERKSWRRL